MNRSSNSPLLANETTPSNNTFGRHASPLPLVVPAMLLLALLWWVDPSKIHIPACSFHAITGLDCPGCGATRATHELLHGRLIAALHYNALWIGLLPLAAYVTLSEWRLAHGYRPLPGNLARRKTFWFAMIAIGLAFSVARNC